MNKAIKLILILSLLLIICCGMLTSSSYAEVPHLINYQGKLTDKNGQPLEGAYTITFRFYDALTGGNLLWEETQNVVIQKGVFSTLLGSSVDLNIPFDKSYYLEIKVGNEVMSPRQRITSIGYAIRAEKAEYAEKADVANRLGIIESGVGFNLDHVPDGAKYQRVHSNYIDTEGKIDKIKRGCTLDSAETRFYSIGIRFPYVRSLMHYGKDSGHEVYLPHGAKVTALRLYSKGIVILKLIRQPQRIRIPDDHQVMANVANNGETKSINYSIIDNQNYCYCIWYQSGQDWSYFYGARIEYTVTKPLP